MHKTNTLPRVKSLFAPFILFSSISNLVVLVSPIFMMQVIDRVVPSGNLNTLYMLLTVTLGAIGLHAFVEYYRDISLKRIAQWVEREGTPLALAQPDMLRQAAIDKVTQVRAFFASQQAQTAINIPWIPLFLIALALISPYFLLLIAAIIGVGLGVRTVCIWAQKDAQAMTAIFAAKETETLTDAADPDLRAGVRAISQNLLLRFFDLQRVRQAQEAASFRSGTFETAILSALRLFAQIAALSLGAVLVVRGELTTGGMIGASIITAKTIQTIEASVTGFASIKAALRSFSELARLQPEVQSGHTEISALSGALACKGLIYPRGNGATPRLDRVSFALDAGECLAIIGDSGSGKTTLLNAIAGIDPCPIGTVFMGETEVRTLGPKTSQEQLGYLPQQARLVKGSLAENISCFAANPSDDEIVRAAKIAGVHGLISGLPNAYETDIGAEPYLLSAGQKQRVALARAIFAQPKYLFLDEPNALLDMHGERQLCDTLAALKAQGTTIVMVLHRSGIMGLADKILVLNQGRMTDFGARGEVLGRLNDGRQQLILPLNTASLQDLHDWALSQFHRHSDQEFAQKAVIAATEMFNAARHFGPDDTAREVTLTFRFKDAAHCVLTLSESIETLAVKVIPKIKSLIRHPEVSMIDLSEDEVSLALLAQISDELTVKNVNKSALYTAKLSSEADTVSSLQETKH